MAHTQAVADITLTINLYKWLTETMSQARTKLHLQKSIMKWTNYFQADRYPSL